MDKEARRVYSIVICFLMIITVIIKITMANLRLNLTLNVIMIALLAVSVHLNSEKYQNENYFGIFDDFDCNRCRVNSCYNAIRRAGDAKCISCFIYYHTKYVVKSGDVWYTNTKN